MLSISSGYQFVMRTESYRQWFPTLSFSYQIQTELNQKIRELCWCSSTLKPRYFAKSIGESKEFPCCSILWSKPLYFVNLARSEKVLRSYCRSDRTSTNRRARFHLWLTTLHFDWSPNHWDPWVSDVLFSNHWRSQKIREG